VERLREELGYPGMKVLQFAFGDTWVNPYLPHNYASPDCVVYTGTHDNDTTVGWYAHLDEAQRHRARSYLGVSGHEINWDFIRSAFASVADMAVVPLQDVLGLGSEARMNFPGSQENNWAWRYQQEQLRPEYAERLANLTEMYARLPSTTDGESGDKSEA
jgi:4-alpha-glucanotransferase